MRLHNQPQAEDKAVIHNFFLFPILFNNYSSSPNGLLVSQPPVETHPNLPYSRYYWAKNRVTYVDIQYV